MKKRNYKDELSEFTRYIRGEMTKREENAFQRKLQKDPFTEEALEGLSQISPEEARSDLDILEKRLVRKTSGSSRMILYRIAASVAVLMIISSVWIIVNREKHGRELLKAPVASEKSAVRLDEVDAEKEASLADETTHDANGGIQSAVSEITAGTPEDQPVPELEIPVTAEERVTEPVIAQPVPGPELMADASEPAPAPATAAFQTVSLQEVSGKIISSEDNMPVPGAVVSIKGKKTAVVTDSEGRFRMPVTDTVQPVLVADFIGMETKEVRAQKNEDVTISMTPSEMALNEVVVVGYGVATKSENNESDKSAFVSAWPANGRAEFNRYIEENIKNPSSLPAGQRAVAVIGFTVRSTGQIDSIKVIRSPGQEFSDEAVRLIREGPAWKPAEENGQPVDEEVRIRIVFK